MTEKDVLALLAALNFAPPLLVSLHFGSINEIRSTSLNHRKILVDIIYWNAWFVFAPFGSGVRLLQPNPSGSICIAHFEATAFVLRDPLTGVFAPMMWV